MITQYRARVRKARVNPADDREWWWEIRDLTIQAPYSDVVHAGVQDTQPGALLQALDALARFAATSPLGTKLVLDALPIRAWSP